MAAYVRRAFTDRSASIPASSRATSATGQRQMDGHPPEQGRQREPPVVARRSRAATTSRIQGQGATSSSPTGSWRESLFNGTCNGEPFTLQVERHKTKYSLFHWGTRADFMVMSARAAELLALMPEKLPPDLSKFLLSRCRACCARFPSRSARK